MKERAWSRSRSTGLARPLHGDGCGGSGSVPVIHSAARGGPECLAGLGGSIKWAAVSRVVGGERPLTTHELARAAAVHRRARRRRHSRGGSSRDRRRSERARLRPRCQATDLSVAQAVVAEGEDLACDRDLGDLPAAALGDALVGGAERTAAGGRVLGGLDERPTWMGPAGQGRRSTRSDAVEVSGARWVALPYIGARGSGAGDRIGAATVHSNAGQHGCARRYVGTRRKLFH